jgi:hypothetical protein
LGDTREEAGIGPAEQAERGQNVHSIFAAHAVTKPVNRGRSVTENGPKTRMILTFFRHFVLDTLPPGSSKARVEDP